jgi:hypothetical protein
VSFGPPDLCPGGRSPPLTCSRGSSTLPDTALNSDVPQWHPLLTTGPGFPLGLGQDAPYAIAFDPAVNYTVLWEGGQSWKFGGGSWSEITTAGAGPPAALASTVNLEQPVGFNSWGSVQTVSGPASSVAMVYDAADGYLLLFAALQPTAISPGLSETWAFESGRWANLTASSGAAPSPRVGSAMSYDGADGYVVLYGGTYLTECARGFPAFCGGTSLTDTWIFQGGAWTNVTSRVGTPPAGGSGATMAFDTMREAVVLITYLWPSYPATVATWEFVSGTWVNATASAPQSTPFYFALGAALTYDPILEDLLLVFSGYGNRGFGPQSNVTWALGSSGWTMLSPTASPSGLLFGEATYDGADGYPIFPAASPISVFADGFATFWTFTVGPLPPPPSIQSFSAQPDPALLGTTVTLHAAASGGYLPVSYAYILPDSCGGTSIGSVYNLTTTTCGPVRATGTFVISVWATDLLNRQAGANATMTVVVTLPSHGSAPKYSSEEIAALSGLGIAVVAGLSIVVWRRRARRASRP